MRRARADPMLVVLLLRLAGQVQALERKPPVTLVLVGAMTWLFVFRGTSPSIPTAAHYALLLVSAFLHSDAWHLYHNLYILRNRVRRMSMYSASLLWKGVQLEGALGSAHFLQLLATLLVLAQGITVAAAYVWATATDSNWPLRQCSIGFSGVLFALKVVLNTSSPARSHWMGLALPTKYLAWVELLYLHVAVPQSSFLGHLAGILAGYLYVSCPTWRLNVAPQRYAYRSGASGHRATASTASNDRRRMEAADAAYARRLHAAELRRR
ncbi:hypothetical protein SDRG_06513, partial [Saprolegnia diclina VS20]